MKFIKTFWADKQHTKTEYFKILKGGAKLKSLLQKGSHVIQCQIELKAYFTD